jgi:transketolase
MRKTALDYVYHLAKDSKKVLFIGSDLGPGVLDEMKSNMPERFFMEGVSEQHIVGMAAGLALEGFIPYVNTIATFLTRRCYEQIALDVCLQNLPVRLIANGGGVVYAPLGPTHLAVEDFAIMRALPNMTVVAPCDADEMRRLMMQSLNWPHPLYIRLGKGGDAVVSQECFGFEIGKAIPLQEPGDGLFITTGVMAQLALQASNQLNKEGFSCGVLHMHTVKPIDSDSLRQWLPKAKCVVTVEEHTRIGGLGSAILEVCNDEMPLQASKIIRIGIPDQFANQYGSQNSLLEYWGINVNTLCEVMRKKLQGT